MNSEIFSHTQQQFFIFIPSVHLSFIGWGSYFFKLPLDIVITSLFLSTWRKRVMTGRAVIISFLRLTGMFLFSFFSWEGGPFMTRFLLEPVCGINGFSLPDSSHHVSQQCFINYLLFLSFIQIIMSETL